MEVYLILLGCITLLAIILSSNLIEKRKKIAKIMFILISFILLFIVMGLRHKSVGVDTSLYCRIYRIFVQGGSSSNFDTSQVYKYYNVLVGIIFGENPQNIIIANSIVILVLFFAFINKASPNVYFSTILYILLYFYLQSFNIARQMIAMLLCAISMRYVIEKDLKKYIILNAIAIFTHNTAIISFAVGLLLYAIKKWDIKKLIILMTAAVASSALLDRLMILFVRIFPKYLSYVNTNEFEYGSSGRKLLLILAYMIFLVLGLIVINKKKNDMDEQEYRKYMIYSTLMAISGFIGVIGIKLILLGRISFYFEIISIIYIPLIIELMEKRKGAWYILVFTMFFIPFYIQLSANISGVVPYKFFWY